MCVTWNTATILYSYRTSSLDLQLFEQLKFIVHVANIQNISQLTNQMLLQMKKYQYRGDYHGIYLSFYCQMSVCDHTEVFNLVNWFEIYISVDKSMMILLSSMP